MTTAVKQQERDLPPGCAPPGALQAYTDAYKATHRPGAHLDAHIAGLRAALSAAGLSSSSRAGAAA